MSPLRPSNAAAMSALGLRSKAGLEGRIEEPTARNMAFGGVLVELVRRLIEAQVVEQPQFIPVD